MDYTKGQGATLLGDVINGTNEFRDKQGKLATSAAFGALKKSMTAGNEREAKRTSGISDDVNADPNSDGYSQQAWQDKANEANKKSELTKGFAGVTTSIASPSKNMTRMT